MTQKAANQFSNIPSSADYANTLAGSPPAQAESKSDPPPSVTKEENETETSSTAMSGYQGYPKQSVQTIYNTAYADALSPYLKQMQTGLNQNNAALAQADQQLTSGSGPNTGLTSSLSNANQVALAGQSSMAQANQQTINSIQSAQKYLPYSDLINTLLTQRKNELLYGTSYQAPTEQSDWPTAMKNIFDYIVNGTGSTGGVSSLADTLPAISAADSLSGTSSVGSSPAGS